ncbi:Undecaprenyl pyrophosphate synthetase / Di-trans,poly-cis-decaprenylcistransferase [Streptococcus sp. DD10]|uniref:isoprenyl transferase n=1 Tax=Streptococcus sp. DD10 TaxID=1777878 RepID=UPI0007948721|nr:isoprenyl transferase [Streptococcus sp. DD10]KXT72201.1 Undecaprenyl pyrophosphate synthetase / Di-trans,poly-cis-decaprenylcistransferase [Streptococcus sp. DD10]
MFRFIKKEKESISIEAPKHIGVIMDGNGRWAKKRMQPRIFGHKAGMEALQNVTIAAKELGVQVLTVYAFSTENWNRPEKEVKFIMNLPVEFYDRFVPELHKNNVKIQMIGEVSRLPKETYEALLKAEELTKLNTGLILNFALNYGGRAEITQAIKEIAQDVLDAKFNPGDITEEMVADYLQTSSLPRVLRDPDLIIRTSGEVRLSNFLPWQSAYSELYFTDVLWPDFDENCLRDAVLEYNKRNRRFGGI